MENCSQALKYRYVTVKSRGRDPHSGHHVECETKETKDKEKCYEVWLVRDAEKA